MKLLDEIDILKSELKILFEDNKKNKEEITTLKNVIILTSRSPLKEREITNIKEIKDIDFNSEEDNTIKDMFQMHERNNIMFSKDTIDTASRKKKSRKKSSKKRKKTKSTKSKSRRKSVIFDENSDEDNTNKSCIGVFLFKQKFKIRENESELDLTNKKIGDRGLESLSQIEFNDLKSLSLDTNGIFVIEPLKNLYLNFLEVLNLDNNSISDISILEYVKFPALQILWLNNNNISDISVFGKAKFNQLLHLYLNNNNITDISVFKRTFLYKLERLYLKNNKIEDISCIMDFDLDTLKLVYLNKNRIDFSREENKNIIRDLKKKIKYLSY